MNVAIEKLKGEFIDNTRAASRSRLAMKKHEALVDFVKSVEPELRQRLQNIWDRLEEEEATVVQKEIDAFKNFDGIKEAGDSALGRALYASLSPMIEKERASGSTAPLNQKKRESRASTSEVIPSLSGPSRALRAGSPSLPRSLKRAFDGLPMPGKRYGHKRSSPTPSAGQSDSSGDIDEEIEARPKRRTLDLSTTLTDRSKSESPVPERRASSSSSSMFVAPSPGPSSSSRSRLRRRGTHQGSYNVKAKFIELGYES